MPRAPATKHSVSTKLETLTGVIDRVTFHSESTGFCVLRIRVKEQRDTVTVTGAAATVTAGENVEATGEWTTDSKHGLQFKAAQLRVIPPNTLEGIEKYLGSGMVKGVGPHFAKQLVQAFGQDVFDIIEHSPEKLRALPGIGAKRQELILSSWADQKAIRAIMLFLQTHGVGTARAVRIYKTYGDEAIDKVRENPYRLALDIYGIGFKSADTLAGRLGIPQDSPLRACAGVLHVLQAQGNDGHCAALQEDLQKKSVALLEIADEIISTAIEKEITEGRLVRENINGEDILFLPALYQAEQSIAARLKCLAKGALPWGEIEVGRAIPWVEEQTHLKLSASQRAAVEKTLKSKVMIITGGPGVGKTTVVNTILKILRAKHVKVALCAPTGRAAKRLSDTTGCLAKTIHRLLEFDPKRFNFKHNQHDPLDVDLLVIDESSMLDVVLMNQLLKAVPDKAAVLFIGDVDQLPSVGPGAVLSDLIESQTIATAFLTEIFRQASTSQIIVNAHRINQGQFPLKTEVGELSDFYFISASSPEEIHEKILLLVAERIPKRFGFHPVRDIQVLTPMNRGGVGARTLNAALQARLNGKASPQITRMGATFAPGDKVIQQINNYDKEVFNGDIGVVSSIDLEDAVLKIDFDGRLVNYEFSDLDEVALAYATSIHKSQGSEYPAVVIPVAMQHFRMLARNLLYTGVTRGKQLVVLVGESRALAMAVKNIQSSKRLTHLAMRLRADV